MFQEERLGDFATLKGIIAKLRSPEGCPWDRQQTHASLRPYLIEECYEVLQALEEGTPQKFSDELGDLLLQIMLHAQIAAENEEFDVDDVIRCISTKLIRRHPHVFGDIKVKGAPEVALNWELMKQQEREEQGSLLAGVPKEMPALARSQAIQRRVAQVGFDWEDEGGILDKITEEAEELKRADCIEERATEFGDLLFILVNFARWLGIDSETALRQANQRFCQRFSYMEKVCRERGIALGDLSFSEQNALWEEAKQKSIV